MSASNEKYQANRGDDNSNEASDSSKKAAKLAAKGAADYYTGGKGGAVVDKLADTKLGDEVLNKAGKEIDKNPLLKKAAKKLDDEGALDAADTALSAVESANTGGGANGGEGLGNALESSGKKEDISKSVANSAIDSASDSSGEGEQDSNSSQNIKPFSSFQMPPISLKTKATIVLFGIVLFIFIGAIVTIFSDGDGSENENNETEQNYSELGESSCVYNIEGFSNGTTDYRKKIDGADIKVRLLECGGFTPVSGESLIDFEKYILGVVYQENGGGSDEAIKTQAVAARSYSLSRPSVMGNAVGLKLEEENGKWILQLRACTLDQAYCDPDKGCWSNGTGGEYGNTIHSGQDTSKAWSKAPLASDSKIRTLVAETAGEVLVNSKGYVLATSYRASDQENWNRMSGLNYKQMLLQYYNNNKNIGASDIVKMNCSSANTSLSSGSFTTWKQSNPTWGSIPLGHSSHTISSAGCLVTSVAMQIAKSGVETTIKPFNPGTFVQTLNSNGGFDGANFYWAKTTVVAPRFVYQNKIYVLGQSKQQKLSQLQSLLNQGYYVVAEVKGNTGQHWVAVDGIKDGNVIMMDPASNSNNMWSQYNPANTSTFAYYKVT